MLPQHLNQYRAMVPGWGFQTPADVYGQQWGQVPNPNAVPQPVPQPHPTQNASAGLMQQGNLAAFQKQYHMPAEGDMQMRHGLTQRQMRGIVGANQQNLLEQIYNQQQFNPVIFRMLMDAATQFTPAGLNTEANAFAANRMAQAGDVGMNMARQFRAQGIGQSGAAGALVQQMNQATRDANAFRHQQQSPDALVRMLQALQQGTQITALPTTSTGASLVYGRPYNTEPKKAGGLGGLLGAVGSVIGMGTGLGLDWSQVLSAGGGGEAVGALTRGGNGGFTSGYGGGSYGRGNFGGGGGFGGSGYGGSNFMPSAGW